MLSLTYLETLEIFAGVGKHGSEVIHDDVELVYFSRQTHFRRVADAFAAGTTTPIVEARVSHLRKCESAWRRLIKRVCVRACACICTCRCARMCV